MYKITYEAFLSLFYRIGDIGLRQFLEGPSSIRIRELNLSNCALLGDASIVKLSERYEKPIYTIALAIVYLLAEKVRERP
jgi:F-box/leucine-rich repeat protein 13